MENIEQSGHKGMARVAAGREDLERAVRLYSAMDALMRTTGLELPPLDTAAYDRAMRAARGQLGEEAFALAWAAGQALPLVAAVALAMEGHEASPLGE